MKPSHAVWGHQRWPSHGGEVLQNVVHWRREWQTTSVFLPWEPMNSMKSESEVSQSCPTLCDPMDCSLPGFSVHWILQAIVLEWIAISFSRGSSQSRDWTRVSRIVDRHFTIWATREAHQVLWSMGFFRHEYWSGLPFPSPGDLPNPGIEPGSPAL